MADKVDDNIYIGSIDDVQQVEADDFDAIVNLSRATTDTEVSPSQDVLRNTHYWHVPIADDGSNDRGRLNELLNMATNVQAQGDTLFYCAAGMSRSPLVVAAVLCLDRRVEPSQNMFEEALDMVREARGADINPHYDLKQDIYQVTKSMY